MALHLILQVLMLVFVLIICWYFIEHLRSAHAGAPFVSTHYRDISKMIDLAGDIRGRRVYDLGSGDGRLVIAAARAGAIATGYEINRFAASLSQFRINRARLKNARIINDSFFNHSIGDADIVFMYLLPGLIVKLKQKLMTELPAHAIIISKGFPIPGWKADWKSNGFYRYSRKNVMD